MVKILCVDDDAMILKGLTAMIQRFELPDTHILTANNAMDALDILKHSGADIVISDIDMPIINGLEFIRTASAHHYCEHFIVLTGYDKFEYVREAIKSNVCDYMLKPINKQELCENLQKLHAQIAGDPAPSVEPLLRDLGLCIFDDNRPSVPPTLRKVLDYIDAKYQIDLSLEMISEAVDLHPNYICALFREHLDTTFLHYLDVVRLRQSVQMLILQPTLLIREIAASTGFLSERHFYKVFKKRLGCTPASLRARE